MTNEERIAEIEENVYHGNMPARNKEVLRAILEKEDRFWARNMAREEEGHSNSVVGDRFNMTIKE